ncbi:MAG: transposase [Deltaproteobacteria bacterium]|nr:transposase [Deltaproteobacteria bacterium]
MFEQLTGWARCQGLQGSKSKCGAVTFIQRFTKALNISPHLQVLVLDGVFANEEEGPRFVECPAPTNRDLLSLAQSVFKKMEKFLAKSGYLRSESDALEEASLTPVERWYVRGLAEPSMLSPSRIVDVKSAAIACGGFSVHAQVRVAQGARRGRERLCLYAPPLVATCCLALRANTCEKLNATSRFEGPEPLRTRATRDTMHLGTVRVMTVSTGTSAGLI